MEKQYLVGIDIGGSGVRTAYFDFQGNCLGDVQAGFSPHFNADGTSHYSIQEMREAMVEAIRKLLAEHGLDSNAIVGIGGSINGCLLVGYGADGEPTTECIFYTDRRLVSHIPRAYDLLGAAGVSPEQFRKHSFSDPRFISGILAIREEDPELAARTVKWGNTVQPFMFSVLGGNWDAEPEDYAGYKDLYNSMEHAFNRSFCDAVGIQPSDILTTSYVCEPCGAVSAAGAELTGLAVGTPLFTGANNQLAQIAAQGAIKPGDLAMNLGSHGCFNQLTKEDVRYDPMIGVLGGTDRETVRVVGNVNFGVPFEWARANLSFGFLAERAAEVLGGDPLAEMTKQAASAPLGSNGVMFAPFLYGRSIYPRVKATYFGISQTTSPADLVRALMEGVAFESRAGIAAVEGGTGHKSELAYVTGAPSKSSVWMQILADVTGMTLHQAALDPKLTGTLGAAIFAGIGAGVYADFPDAVEQAVKPPRTIIEPNPENVAAYEPLYQEYSRLADLLCNTIY